jgi:hypothetical protein
MTSTPRVRKLHDKRRKEGFIRPTVWIRPEHRAELFKFVAELNQRKQEQK